MGAKHDIKQVNSVAALMHMSPIQRREFGDYLELQKRLGNGGTANDRGDFTYQELIEKAVEFLEGE
ncbi:MAG: hypothetical protein U0798_20470 [Gemmataceae bacterium]